MTRPITVMEWLCYSWLHTAVCSHSHSPPVQTHRQRQRHAAFQTHVCRIHLSHKIVPQPSDNIKKIDTVSKINRTTNGKRNRAAVYTYTYTNHTVDHQDRNIHLQNPLHSHTHSCTVNIQTPGECRSYVYIHVITIFFKSLKSSNLSELNAQYCCFCY